MSVERWQGFALGLVMAWAFSTLTIGAGIGFLAGSALTILGLGWSGRKEARGIKEAEK